MAGTTMPLAFRGVPTTTLQAWLSQAQGALAALSSGAQSYRVSYSQGMGSREVTYLKTNLGDLSAWIASLQVALGQPRPRAVGVWFR